MTAACEILKTLEKKQYTNQNQMGKINKAALPGRYKPWCFQHGVLPRLVFSIPMYNIPISRVDDIDRAASKHLRQWLGVPQIFFRCQAVQQVQHATTSPVVHRERVQGSRVRGHTLLDESSNINILHAKVQLTQSCCWSVKRTMDEAKRKILRKELGGTGRQRRRLLNVSERKCQ